MFKCFFSCTK